MKLKSEIFEQLQEQLHSTFASLFGGEPTEPPAEPEVIVLPAADLNKFKVTELKTMAKERGLKGYTGLRKAELVEMLQQN